MNAFMNLEHYVPNIWRQYDKRKHSCNYERRIGFCHPCKAAAGEREVSGKSLREDSGRESADRPGLSNVPGGLTGKLEIEVLLC